MIHHVQELHNALMTRQLSIRSEAWPEELSAWDSAAAPWICFGPEYASILMPPKPATDNGISPKANKIYSHIDTCFHGNMQWQGFFPYFQNFLCQPTIFFQAALVTGFTQIQRLLQMCQTCTKPGRELFIVTPRKHQCSNTAASPWYIENQLSGDPFSRGPM